MILGGCRVLVAMSASPRSIDKAGSFLLVMLLMFILRQGGWG